MADETVWPGMLVAYRIAKGDLPDDLQVGAERPGLVVKVGQNAECNMHVFLDDEDMHVLSRSLTIFKKAVAFDGEGTPGTWG